MFKATRLLQLPLISCIAVSGTAGIAQTTSASEKDALRATLGESKEKIAA